MGAARLPLLVLILVTFGVLGGCGDGDAAPVDGGPDDGERTIDAGIDAHGDPPHCDSVMYWCEGGHVFLGYIDYQANNGCAPVTCSACSPADTALWDQLNDVGSCANGCRPADAGASCEYWDAIGGMGGSYPEDAMARLCAP